MNRLHRQREVCSRLTDALAGAGASRRQRVAARNRLRPQPQQRRRPRRTRQRRRRRSRQRNDGGAAIEPPQQLARALNLQVRRVAQPLPEDLLTTLPMWVKVGVPCETGASAETHWHEEFWATAAVMWRKQHLSQGLGLVCMDPKMNMEHAIGANPHACMICRSGILSLRLTLELRPCDVKGGHAFAPNAMHIGTCVQQRHHLGGEQHLSQHTAF